MAKKSKEISNKEYVNTKPFWCQLNFDECVELNQELQAKLMFLGERKDLTKTEQKLLDFTNDVMFGNYEEVVWQ